MDWKTEGVSSLPCSVDWYQQPRQVVACEFNAIYQPQYASYYSTVEEWLSRDINIYAKISLYNDPVKKMARIPIFFFRLRCSLDTAMMGRMMR